MHYKHPATPALTATLCSAASARAAWAIPSPFIAAICACSSPCRSRSARSSSAAASAVDWASDARARSAETSVSRSAATRRQGAGCVGTCRRGRCWYHMCAVEPEGRALARTHLRPCGRISTEHAPGPPPSPLRPPCPPPQPPCPPLPALPRPAGRTRAPPRPADDGEGPPNFAAARLPGPWQTPSPLPASPPPAAAPAAGQESLISWHTP